MADQDLRPRLVTLVLCQRDGTVVGALEPFEAAMPYWQDLRDVSAGARARHGIEVTVLRLLESGPPPAGGPVTYLAEFEGPTPSGLGAWPGDPTAPEPLRLPYASPGGPAADVAWALRALADRGIEATGTPQQLRTWNLSAITCIPTTEGPAWLKCVPPFLAHEGALMRWLGPADVPEVLAADGARILLRDVPGDDHYGAGLELRLRLMTLLHRIQSDQAGHTDTLLAMGLPDWRETGLGHWAAHVVNQAAAGLDRNERIAIDSLLSTWSRRFAALADCGIPDTLVHGDLHPGNARGDGDRLVILDWGDSGVGHPLLDQSAFLHGVEPVDAATLRHEWVRLWRATIPGSDPERAAALLAPVAAIRHAAVYQNFLDRIEPDERIYHESDPLDWLRRTAELVAGSGV